ncbi:hypothetical protein B0H16DRAFT_1786699 [Mycena metata]|uniref:Uncharacterized protein n=1 Tax=Mycena metata TaxID=1033252 RepID=A0AAD7HMX4_9AGAR|nr:hypothetical protein B0H16DRAFT_1786699 [Mycena metata]
MNPDFLAGAVDVIDCFVRELGVLQTQLKEEETRIGREDNAAQEEREDLELSVLEITKTALVVTRERLAKERSTKKSLQREMVSIQAEAHMLREKLQTLSEGKDKVLARNAELQETIDERHGQIRAMENALSVARQDTVKAETELASANSRLAALKQELSELVCYFICHEHASPSPKNPQKTSEALGEDRRKNVQLKSEGKPEEKERVQCAHAEEELAHTREELAQANAKLNAHDQQLAMMQKKLRMSQKDTAAANSTSAKIRSRCQVLNTHHKLAKQKSKAEYAALQQEHEALKVTTRELIEIVEAHEAAAEKNKDAHSAANCTYHAKYKKVKAENKELCLRLSESNSKMVSTIQGGSGSLKRKTEEDENGESGLHDDGRRRRVRFSA